MTFTNVSALVLRRPIDGCDSERMTMSFTETGIYDLIVVQVELLEVKRETGDNQYDFLADR